ncbi:MAG: M48 family metallopeptidase [Roseiflexaceae bacterium]
MPTPTTIIVDGISIAITYKRMKTITLRVRTPSGDVVVSAPLRTPQALVRAFVETKIPWIRTHRQRIQARAATHTPDLRDDGTVRVWGSPLPLTVTSATRRSVRLIENTVLLTHPADDPMDVRQTLIDLLYRRLVSAALPALVTQWSTVMQVTVQKTFVQKMKTRWGSCNYRAHHIRLNSDLASYPPHCLEYVVVHELVHLLEPSHNARFYALMTQFYPDWPAVRALLRHGGEC